MIDREKVIKGLEWILEDDRFGFGVNWNTDSEPKSEEEQAGCNIQNAIALLKEQEEQIKNRDESLEKAREEIKWLRGMLKEQEAEQVIKQTYHVMVNRDYENPVEATRYDWLCPTCKSLLCRDIDVIDDNYHFCKVCGQAVKWE